MLNKFKQLVDNIEATIFAEEDFEAQYNINLEDKPFDYPSIKFSEELNEIIKNCTEGLKGNILNIFMNELIYRQVIYDEDLIQYMQIISVIRDTVGQINFLPNLDDDQWIDIIQLSKNYLNFSNLLNITIESMKEIYPKEFNRAESTKFLVNKNCDIKIENGDIIFVSGLDSIYKELDDKIEKIGGINLIRMLSNLLLFNMEYKRYLYNRKLTASTGRVDVDTPWGYLFNLALKHHNIGQLSEPDKIKLFLDILKLSSIVINAVYNNQEYNIFAYYFIDFDILADYFSKLVLYDSIFCIPQSNIDLQLMLCEYSFSDEEEFFKEKLNFNLDEYLLIIKLITEYFDENKYVFTIKVPNQLPYGLTREKIIEILKFMSHNDEVNKNYLEPSNYNEINYYKKPLLQLGDETFFLPPIPFASPNFYEALFFALKEYYEGNDSLGKKLGDKLELTVETLLQKNGIEFIRGGRYKFDGNPTECDFLIESTNSIIIIEIKKKSLTRESKSGIDYSIFIDLSKSLLSSQYQALRVEYLLKNKGQFHIKNENVSKQIKWDKKIIKRISLSQSEFLTLHNKLFIKHFMFSVLIGEFTLDNATDDLNEKFRFLKNYQRKFKDLYGKIYDVKDFNEFLVRTYFLSLDQLFVIINNSHDNDSFDENLPNQRIIDGAFDWFMEYDKFNKRDMN